MDASRVGWMAFAVKACFAILFLALGGGFLLTFSGIPIDFFKLSLGVMLACTLILIGCFVYGFVSDRRPDAGQELTRHYGYVISRTAVSRGRELAD